MANVKSETIEEIDDDIDEQAADKIRASVDTAFKALVGSMKAHTNRLKQSKESLENLDPQFETCKQVIVAEFDVAMGILLKRRNGLLKALEVAYEENNKTLSAQVKRIQNASNSLIACKETCKTHIKNKDTKGAIEAVLKTLNEVKNSENEIASVQIQYKTPDQKMNEFLESYGTVSVAKTVRKPKGAKAQNDENNGNDDAKQD